MWGKQPFSLLCSGRFFNLLCMMEHIDVVLKWYKQIIPSVSAYLLLSVCSIGLYYMHICKCYLNI